MGSKEKMEIINKIQETIKTPKIHYIVFHQDNSYTVTQNLDWAMRANEPIYAMTMYNVFQLGKVQSEQKEKVKQYLKEVTSMEISHEEELDKVQEEYNPFHELPFVDYEEDFDIQEVFELFTEPLLEQPNLVFDIFTVACHELGYYSEEINDILQYLGRLLPIYKQFLTNNKNNNQYKYDIDKLNFIAEQVLSSFDKSKGEIDLMKNVLNEKLLEADSVLQEQAQHILAELLVAELTKTNKE